MRFGLAALILPALLSAQTTLHIPNESAPPGSAIQIKLILDTPARLRAAAITLDLDPATFGDIAQFATFSATGDAIAYATVSGRHIEAHLTSQSSSLGQLPGQPILTVNVPILPTAKPGDTAIAATTDAGAVTPGILTVAGALAISAVTIQPPNQLHIAGSGFAAATPVSIDGAVISGLRFLSPQALDVTVAPTELTGKVLHVGSTDYWLSLSSAPAITASGGLQFAFPLFAYTSGLVSNVSATHPQISVLLVLQNPGPAPVTVLLQGAPNLQSVSVAPASIQTVNVSGLGPNIWFTATSPIRILIYSHDPGIFSNPPTTSLGSPQSSSPVAPPPLRLPISTNTVAWSWQSGAAAPPPATVTVSGNVPFSAALPTVPWLAVFTSATGVTLSPKVTGLAPGTYHATVTLNATLAGFTIAPAPIDVTLTVTSGAQLLSSPVFCCSFVQPAPTGPATGPQSVSLTSNGAPAAFTVTVSGGQWLSVTPSSGTTPATLTFTATPLGLGLAGGTHHETVTVQGPANTLTYDVMLLTFGAPPPPPPPSGTLQLSRTPLSFYATAGTTPPLFDAVLESVSPAVAIQVLSNSPWLTATILANAPAPPNFTVYANAATLAAGTYNATVTVSATGFDPIQLPVTFTVLPVATKPVAVTPASLTFTSVVNDPPSQKITVDSPDGPTLVTASFPLTFAAAWAPSIQVQSAYQSPDGKFLTPATITVTAYASDPGRYQSSIIFTTAAGSVTVPVTYVATPTGSAPPILASVVNGASFLAGPIGSRRVLGLFGWSLGPGSQVLLNGAPLPVLYASPSQLNVAIPDDFNDTSGTATLQVSFPDVPSAAWELPLAPPVPAIFTLNGSGVGPVAAPARAGTLIEVYATGVDPKLPITLKIGGQSAAIQYNAATTTPGVYQLNAVVPTSLPAGTYPIILTTGAQSSPPSPTVAVAP